MGSLQIHRKSIDLQSSIDGTQIFNYLKLKIAESRDGSIAKFQPIPILEFLCQPIP